LLTRTASRHGLPVDHVYNSDYSGMKSIKMKKIIDTVCNLLRLEFEDYMTCDSALKVCGVYIVDHVCNQRFTRPGEELKWKRQKVR
jgi:hypothetical protein